VKKYFIKKYNGDDQYSWALFFKGQRNPIITGMMRKEAQYYREKYNRIPKEKRK